MCITRMMTTKKAGLTPMKVKDLIQKLQQHDPELDVVAGSEEDDDIISVYHCNVYQGQGIPSRSVIWIDTKPDYEG